MGSTASRLYERARAAHQSSGRGVVIGLLDRALSQRPEPLLRARIQHLRGQVEMWSEAPMRVHELLVTEAAAVEGLDCQLAAMMLCDAAQAAVMAGEASVAAATNARALALAQRAPMPVAASIRLFGQILARPVAGGQEAIGRALAEIDGSEAAETLEALQRFAANFYWLEDYAAARRVLQLIVERGRALGHPIVAVALDTLAAVCFSTGRWSLTDAYSAEALRLARQHEQGWVVASCLTTRARLEAARGREQQCRRQLRQAREASVPGDLAAGYAASAAGLLELGLGKPEAAAAELEPLQASQAEQLPWSPLVVQSTPDLIEAYVRSGQHSRAAELARPFQQRAHDSQLALALALAARCDGLTASAGEFDHHFKQALDHHTRTPTPFERARTELCYGERLRRARRKPDATPLLRSALATFQRLGAQPWAQRTQRELQPARTAPTAGGLLQQLTPHELQVALLVSRGATNKQAAKTLFVSPKTVDYHLHNIYKKLGIHSRTELAYRIAQQPQ